MLNAEAIPFRSRARMKDDKRQPIVRTVIILELSQWLARKYCSSLYCKQFSTAPPVNFIPHAVAEDTARFNRGLEGIGGLMVNW
jgi:hypothetical protein